MKKYVESVKGIKNKLHLTRKHFVIVGTVTVIALSSTTVAIVYKVTANGVEQTVVKTMTVNAKQGDLSLGVSGSGTTYVGNVDQTWDVGYGSSGIVLTVEEVLAAAGDKVSKGDGLLRVSKQEVAELITYYEEQIANANNTLKTAKLTYESNLAQAKFDYESNLMLGDTALLQYQASVDELQNKVDEAKEAIDNSDAKIAEYSKALTKDTYYSKYNVGTLKNTLNAANKTLKTATTAFDKVDKSYQNEKKALEQAVKSQESKVKEAEKKTQSAENTYNKKLQNMLALIDSKNNPSSYEVEASYLTELKKAYEELESAKQEKLNLEQQLNGSRQQLEKLNKDYETAKQGQQQASQKQQEASRNYEQAVSSYEKEKEEATTKLKSLKNNASTLKADYDAAVLNKETQTISLNKEYKISSLTYENAKSIYDAAVKDLDADVTKAEKNLEELKDTLATLTTIKGDGIIKASQDGTIASVGYEAENEVVAGQSVAAYTVPGTIDIDITVSQNEISSIKVGDTANVRITGERGTIEGKIKEIATQPTTSGSVSNVTYTVTVEVDNSEGSIKADTEATVSVVTETLENVIYVPVNAVTKAGDTHTVTRQKSDGKTEKVTVKTGKDNGTYIVITEGLSAGDTCVMEQK